MEPLFEKGQTVRIAPRKRDSSDYRFGYASGMCKYAHRIATITDVDTTLASSGKVPDDGYKYEIDLDEGCYTWASSMFISIEDKSTSTSTDEPISTEIHIHIKRDTKIKFNFKN